MQHSLSEMLLLDNELYLQAVQHKKISIKSLGLQEVHYGFNSSRNTSGRKSLKAVIPSEDQKDFLRMAGLLGEEFPRIPENRPFSPEKSTSQSRKERQKRRKEAHNHAKNKNGHTKHTKPAEPLFTHQPVRRTSVGGTPAYAKHSEAHLKALELEKQQAIERNKEKERLAKLGKNFDITDSEGVRYVYDYRGFKVPEEQFQRQLEEIEREKKRKSQEKKVPPHGVELIEKTRRFVEDLRKRVELETVIDYRWYPGKFPASTIPPRSHSAGHSRRGGTVRDVSQLGKTLPSPFRSGEVPVLPLNLVCQWPEYRVMEAGDVVLTVEHCCHCHEHERTTHHKEEQYFQYAESVRKALTGTAAKYAVRFYSVLKPIEAEDPLARSLGQSEKRIGSSLGGHLRSSQHTHCPTTAHLHDVTAFNIDYSQRIGAFEVQVAVRTQKGLVCHLLFSKLFRGVWPSIPALQSLLERLFAEARIAKLDNCEEDSPRHAAPARGKGKRGMRRSAPQFEHEEEEEELAQLPHEEFDQRDLSMLEEEKAESVRSERASSSSTPVPPIALRVAGDGSGAASPSKNPDDQSEETAPPGPTSEEEAERAFQTYQQQHAPDHQQARVQRPAPSSFSSDTSDTMGFSPRSSKKFASAKAAMWAVGAAASGLNMLRASKVAEQSTALPTPSPVRQTLSLKQAAAIAAGAVVSSQKASPVVSPAGTGSDRSDLTRKAAAVGVLSRQNAGDSVRNSRYLQVDVDDEDEEPERDAPQLGPAASPEGPAHRLGRSPSILRTAAFTPSLASVKMGENEDATEEDGQVEPAAPLLLQRSPVNSSSKKLSPVATAVVLTTSGLNLVRQRAASITTSSPTALESDKASPNSRSTQSEKLISKMPSAKQLVRSAHPSLEMRSRLDIGRLSRQNADKILIVPSDDDDDIDLDNESYSAPPPHITTAMQAAVRAVELTTDASEKRATTATAASTAPAAPSYSHAASTGHPAAAPLEMVVESASATSIAPFSTQRLPGTATAAAADAVPKDTVIPTHTSTVAGVELKASPDTADTAGATAATPAPVPMTFAATQQLLEEHRASALSPLTGTETPPTGLAVSTPPLSATELLQSRRQSANRLLQVVTQELGGQMRDGVADDYADESFEDFSPTRRAAIGDGYEDLFETAEFNLDQAEG